MLTGFLAHLEVQLPVDSEVWIALPEGGRRVATIRWRGDDLIGCEFETPLSEHVFRILTGDSAAR